MSTTGASPLHLVGVGEEGGPVEEAREGGRLRGRFVVGRRGQKLGEVLEAILALLAVLVREHGRVSRAGEDALEQPLDGQLQRVVAQAVHELAEAREGLGGPGGEERLVHHLGERVPR